MGVAVVVDDGQLTTPQLHWFVIRSNAHLLYNSIICGGVGSSCSIKRGYLDRMVSAYVSLIEKIQQQTHYTPLPQPNYHINNTNDTISRKSWILVDCACGVRVTKISIPNYILK